MKINPHDPAYPSHGSMGEVAHTGIPIRLELAARFMAGELAAPNTAVYSDDGAVCITVAEVRVAIASRALAFADALIAAYNEGQE